MFDIGGGELILILLVILLLFGPKKIPEFAQMVGKGMNNIKKAQSQLQSQIHNMQQEMKIDPDDLDFTKPAKNNTVKNIEQESKQE